MPTNSSRRSGPSRSGTSASRNDSSSARVKLAMPEACRTPGSEPSAGRYRPTTMRRLLGMFPLLLALAVLSGCGDDEGTAGEPGSAAAEPEPEPEPEPELVQMLVLTSAGGEVSP